MHLNSRALRTHAVMTTLLRKVFSLSTLATCLAVLYVVTAAMNLSRLMYPLQGVDLSAYAPSQLIKPLWSATGAGNNGNGNGNGNGRPQSTGMKVYLSTRPRFALDFLKADANANADPADDATDTVLLWEESDATVSSLARSFILSGECNAIGDDGDSIEQNTSTCASSSSSSSSSFDFATKWLDDAEEKHALESGDAGVITAMHHAGEGIESTSLILSLYHAVSGGMDKMMSMIRGGSDDDTSNTAADDKTKSSGPNDTARTIVPISPKSPIWKSIVSNSTVHVHVVLIRHADDDAPAAPPTDLQEAAKRLRQSFQTNNAILGHVSMVKYDTPNHIGKPRRVLYHDVSYLFRRYILRSVGDEEPKPWDIAASQPDDYQVYENAQQMKKDGIGYPFWKPEVSVKLVSEDLAYPDELIGRSGMEVVQLRRQSAEHPSGYAYLPGLRVDEIGLTSEKYIALNETVTALPLRISFDRNDVLSNEEPSKGSGSVSQGGLSPARWRLLSHFSEALESQRELGFEQSDIDDLRRLIAETNVTLLGITMLASTLHLLFEFLTFKSDIDFWKGNKE